MGVGNPASYGNGVLTITSCSNIGNIIEIVDESTETCTGGILGSGMAYSTYAGPEYEYIKGSLTISYCSNTGDVVGGKNDYSYTGGIIGDAYAGSGGWSAHSGYGWLTIHDSYSFGGSITASAGFVGGIAGELIVHNYASTRLQNSYIKGCVKNGSGSRNTGGLIGALVKNETAATYPLISNCVAILDEIAGGDNVHRVLGNSKTVNDGFMYSDFEGDITSWLGNGNFGHVIGEEDTDWNADLKGMDGENVIAPELLKTVPFYSKMGWDFTTIWNMDMTGMINEGYPYLNLRNVELINHMISIEVAPGIEPYNFSAGNSIVNDGDHWHLIFFTEDPTTRASDILFLIDDIETPLKDFGGRYAFSYILNNIHKDHTVLIAMKKYPVSFQQTEGVSFIGNEMADYGKPYTFTLDFPDNQEDADIDVRVNGERINPLPPSLRSTSMTYQIDRVTGPIGITVEGHNITGNTDIRENTRVWTDKGILYVDTPQPTTLSVYTITGNLVATQQITAGTTAKPLPQGLYVVAINNKVMKIIVY